MCFTNFLCFICGVAVLALGIYLLVGFKMTALTPNVASANMLIISGIVITCVSFLGFLGALKENRCLLLMFFLLLFCLMLLELTAACLLLVYESKIGELVREELNSGLKKALNSTDEQSDWNLMQEKLGCCGVANATDWGDKVPSSCKDENMSKGCFEELKNLFEQHFLTTGISVIVLCIVEVLGMCFAMTLYCHISRTGLGNKL